MDYKNMSILNKINYKSFCKDSYETVIHSYIGIIRAFMIDYKKIIMLNNEYYNFIMEKGIRCITNIYSIFLNYSNNIEFAEVVSKNALLYFIEFIGQIKQTSLTDFNSKDVLLFVYKKTIFDVIKTEYSYIHMNKLEWVLQIYIYMILHLKLSNEDQDKWVNLLTKIKYKESLESLYQCLVLNDNSNEIFSILNEMDLNLYFQFEIFESSLRVTYKQ